MAVFGVYRGICVDNNDPQGVGRVRVQVPQVLGDSASGWAFPAWSLHDTTIWPRDRLPRPGQGVWVLFESSDRLTWISVFGLPEESLQFFDTGEYADITYSTVTGMKLPVMPVDFPVPITGTLLSPYGEVPGPGAVLSLEGGPDGENWSVVQADIPVDNNGAWSLVHARAVANTWFRAVFGGLEPFLPSSTDPVPILDPDTPTTLTWNSPVFPWQRSQGVTGTLRTPTDPCPAARVVLIARQTGAPYTEVASCLTDSTGSYGMTWTRPESWTQAVDVRCVFPGSEDWDYSERTASLPVVTVTTNTTWSHDPITRYGQTVRFQGTCTSYAYGRPYPFAEVVLQTRSPSATGAWESTQTRSSLDGIGNWSFSHVVDKTDCSYRALFPGAGVYLSSMTTVTTAKVMIASVVSAPVVPSTVVHGQTVTVSGTVTDDLGHSIRTGTVMLWTRWSEIGGGWISGVGQTVAVTDSGTWSMSHGPIDQVGTIQFYAEYLENPGAGISTDQSPTVNRNVGLSAPTVSKGTITTTSVGVYWGAVSGATSYDVSISPDNGTSWTIYGIGNVTSYTASGFPPGAVLSFRVRCSRRAVGNTYTVYSPWSNVVRGNTGIPAWY